MTENREDERIQSALNRVMSGFEGNPYLARRVIAASKGDVKVKKKISLATVMLVVLLLTTVTTFAVTTNTWKITDDIRNVGDGEADALLTATEMTLAEANQKWTIADYIRNVEGGKVDDDFETGFDQDITFDFEGIRFHVRDAYAAGNKIIVVTEATCLENDTTMLLPDRYCCEWDEGQRAFVYIKELAGVDEEITLSEYAEQRGLSIKHISCTAWQKDNKYHSMGNEWIEHDTTLLNISYAEELQLEDDIVEVEMEVAVIDYSDDPVQGDWTWGAFTFQLPVEKVQKIEIYPYPRETIMVDDIPVTLYRVRLMPTRLETQVEIVYRTDSQESAEKLLAAYRFKAVDPTTLDLIEPGTSSNGPKILGASDGYVSLAAQWTLGGSLDRKRLYLQLLPIYTDEGEETEHGLADEPIIKVDIPATNE